MEFLRNAAREMKAQPQPTPWNGLPERWDGDPDALVEWHDVLAPPKKESASVFSCQSTRLTCTAGCWATRPPTRSGRRHRKTELLIPPGSTGVGT